MAESLELNAPVASKTAPRRGSAALLFGGLLRLVGCEPGRVAAYDLVRIALGVVLLTAAGLKGHQLATSPTAETGVLTSRWFLIAIVECELALGVWLISGLYARAARYVSIASFALFCAVSLFRGLRGDASCGCFGPVQVSPWWTAALDLAGALALLSAKPAAAANAASRRLPREALLAAMMVSALVALPMARYRPAALTAIGDIIGDARPVLLEPESWARKPFPLFGYIDIAPHLSKGDWNILFYHHDCPECQWIIQRRAAQFHATDSRQRLAYIEVPPLALSRQPPAVEAPAMHGKLLPSREWFIATPVEVILHDGVVAEVRSRPMLVATASASP